MKNGENNTTMTVKDAEAFVAAFDNMAAYIHDWARRKGFWDGVRNDGEMLMLATSELAEALEAIRNGNPADDKVPEFDGYTAEIADCIIRLLDLSAGRGLPVASAIVAKMLVNEKRPYRHGKRF